MGHATGSRSIAEWISRRDRIQDRGSTQQIDAHVGGRLRARRREVGLSQDALGRLVGVTFSQVQKYENGSNRIGSGRLYQLADLLSVRIEFFFDGLKEQSLNSAGEGTEDTPTDAVRLQEVFARIPDPQARQALLALASSLVRDS
jgi:transcriptional regulator with XRE-family HTH domain